jgi:hypothetical protein
MSPPIPDEPFDAVKVDDTYLVEPPGGCPCYIDPTTGFFALLSPPGTPPVTSQDVRRLLEDFP